MIFFFLSSAELNLLLGHLEVRYIFINNTHTHRGRAILIISSELSPFSFLQHQRGGLWNLSWNEKKTKMHSTTEANRDPDSLPHCLKGKGSDSELQVCRRCTKHFPLLKYAPPSIFTHTFFCFLLPAGTGCISRLREWHHRELG